MNEEFPRTEEPEETPADVPVEKPVDTRDDRVPLTFEEFKVKGTEAAIHVKDNIFIPFRRTVRNVFNALTSGADAAAKELSGEKKDDS